MKRKLIALSVLVGGPLVLALLCGGLFLVGMLGWWAFSSSDEGRLIRIAPLAPLRTPAADVAPADSQAAEEQPAPASGQAEPPAAQPERQTESESASTTPPETTQQPAAPGVQQNGSASAQPRNFVVPQGAVSATTPEGVASRLVIPSLKLDAPVVISPIENQTWRVNHLGQKVGHLEGTARPGSTSNIVLAAHVTLNSGVYGPFAGLAQLSPGDEIFVYEGEQRFRYVVDTYQTVDRTAIEVTHPTQTGQLTLITCSNWDNETGRYVERLIVRGSLVEG